MSTSSVSTFDLLTSELISDALADLGVIGPGDTATATQLKHGRRILNTMVKSMEAEGAMLWRFSRREATLTAGTASFTPASDVLDIDEPANYRTSSSTTSRTPMLPYTRDEYMALTDRTTQGTPVYYYIEKSLNAMTVYLYPVPDTTGAVMEYAAVLKSKDHTNDGVTADFPQKWLQCLRHGLSGQLAPAYAQDPLPFATLFEMEKAKVLADDSERGGIQFAPFGTSFGGW